MSNETFIILSKEYKFSAGNSFVNTNKLKIHGVTSRVMKFWAPVKQIYKVALTKHQITNSQVYSEMRKFIEQSDELKVLLDKAREDRINKDTDNDTGDINAMLDPIYNTDVDSEKFFECLKNLFCGTGVVTVGETTFNLQFNDYDNLSSQDVEQLAKSYLFYFLD